MQHQARTLARKFNISHEFSCGADGRADVRSRDYQNFLNGWVANFRSYGAPLKWRSNIYLSKVDFNYLNIPYQQLHFVQVINP